MIDRSKGIDKSALSGLAKALSRGAGSSLAGVAGGNAGVPSRSAGKKASMGKGMRTSMATRLCILLASLSSPLLAALPYDKTIDDITLLGSVAQTLGIFMMLGFLIWCSYLVFLPMGAVHARASDSVKRRLAKRQAKKAGAKRCIPARREG